MLTTFINTLMSAEADAVCGAEYGARSPERTNIRDSAALLGTTKRTVSRRRASRGVA